MKYRLKIRTINAIQYLREDNIHQVLDFFRDRNDAWKIRYQQILNEYGVAARDKDGLHYLHILESGEWIVEYMEHEYMVLSDEEFQKLYERDES